MRVKMDSQLCVIQDLQECLHARDDELTWVLTDQTKLTRELEQSRSRSGTPAVLPSTSVDGEKGVERSANGAKFVRSGEVAAVAIPTAAYFNLLAECDEHKSRCEKLILENQCIPGLTAEAKALRENVANLRKSKVPLK